MVLTSFRIVLISAPKTKIGKWKSVNLALPLIYEMRFEKPFFADDYFSGKCRGVQEELSTILEFKVRLRQGSIKSFEVSYGTMLNQIYYQMSMRMISPDFYYLLETGQYQSRALLYDANNNGYSLVLMQPGYEANSNPLIDLMEKILPGITKLGRVPLIPDGAPSKPEPIPIPVIPSGYPDFPPKAIPHKESVGTYPYPVIEDYQKLVPKISGCEYYCGRCGVLLNGANSIKLTCGDFVHSHCWEK